nr:PREDICTED: uncharacterized protein LOC105679244 [Linepithema humile]
MIVAEGYLEAEIIAEQLTLLRGAVLKKIDGIQEDPVPRFHSTSLRSGTAVVRCADEASLGCLVWRIGGIIPWEGVKLKVMGMDALQRQHRAVVWVPGPPESAATVLKRLEKQNPGLVTGSWKVFAEGIGATKKGGNLVLGVPESSVLKLRTLDFKSFFGLDRIAKGPRLFGQQQAGKQTCISLMQEPWVIRGCVKGLAACGKLFRAPSVDRPRACVAVKGMETQLIPHLCSRDVAAVEVHFTADSGDRRKMVACSAYFSHDEGKAVPPAPGSSDTNERGRKVLEFLASTDLEILNTGDELTFCTIARREVLDITVCSRLLIQEWSGGEDLASSLRGFPKRHGTEDKLETCVDYLQRSLVNESNCPKRAVTNSRGTSWWTPGLQGLRVAAFRVWKRARNTGRQSDWELSRRA